MAAVHLNVQQHIKITNFVSSLELIIVLGKDSLKMKVVLDGSETGL